MTTNGNSSAKETQEQLVCPLCDKHFDGNLGSHIRQVHGKEALHRAVLRDKEQGMPDPEIGTRYGISFHTLEQIITAAYGANISVRKRSKRVKRWEPSEFRRETTTVWSFKRRGDWATHDGRYRGNWSPYIPRNVILKYSSPGDVVLDYFAGGGTTAVEAKLLGRRCIARDINPGAVGITLENLKFSPPRQLSGECALPPHEPKVSIGDARDLSDIPDSSIDLVCAHPPYAGIIKYSSGIAGDLSDLSVQEFLAEMSQVARESLRVLKPGRKCAILIGDARRSKHVVPIGFQTICLFLNAGFVLKELVIKRQHNCKTTGFWYTRSIQYNFLLLAHEHLPIFEKPSAQKAAEQPSLCEYSLSHHIATERVDEVEKENLESTTVWILPENHLETELRRNVLKRFANSTSEFIEVRFGDGDSRLDIVPDQSVSLMYIHWPEMEPSQRMLRGYRTAIREMAERARTILSKGGFFVLEARDFRTGKTFWPTGLLLYEDMAGQRHLALKEIVFVVPEGSPDGDPGEHLAITHRHLLIYMRQ